MHKKTAYQWMFSLLIPALMLGVMCSLFGCQSCEEIDDAAQIRTIIEQAAQHAEAHAIGKLLGLATEDLVVEPGKLDRGGAKGALFMVFQNFSKFKISYPWPTINVDPSGGYAEARVPFVVVREGVELPDLTDLYEDPENWSRAAKEKADLFVLDLGLIKKSDEWKVRRAQITGTRGL